MYSITFSNLTNDRILDLNNVVITAVKGTFIASDSALQTVSGNWTNFSFFTHSSGTITFDNTATKTLTTGGTVTGRFNNITHSGAGRLELSGNLRMDGDFLNSGGIFDSNAATITSYGNFTLESGSGFARTAGNTITFVGTTSTTFADNNATSQNVGAVTITKTNATPAINKITLAGNMKVDTLTISANNTLDLASSGYVLDLANAGATATVLTVTGTLTVNTNSTVKYSATNSGGNVTVPVVPYNSLQISGAETYALANNLTGANAITGNLTIDNGATLTTGTNYNIALNGNWVNGATGVFTSGTGTVTLYGTTAQTVTAGGTDDSHDFYNLTVTNSGGPTNGITFLDSLTIHAGGRFTDSTADSKLTFADGGTYSFPLITIAGTTGHNVLMQHTAGAHGHWHFVVPGSPAATYVTPTNSDATGSGAAIDVTTGGVDGGGNTNWNFGSVVPNAPTIGAPTVLSATSIRWSFTDNSSNETGFKVYDSGDSLLVTCASTNLTYCDETGLSINAQYTGRYVVAYNGTGNSAHSATAASVYTLANTPLAPTVNTTSSSSLTVIINENSNPAATTYAIQETEQSGGQYLQADGTLGASAVWQTYAQWGGVSGLANTGLSTGTSYTYKVKAKNGDATETSFGSTTQQTTTVTGNNISGSLYDAIGGSKITAAKTIKVSVNGGEPTSASSSSGDFTVRTAADLGANDIVTVFVDGDAVVSSTVTRVSATGDLTGINLYSSLISGFLQGN
jgi:hypothetical protein